MRNLKRALSLALASIMVLGMMVVGAGAVSVNDFSDGEKIVNKEAVTVLATLNVINGKDDGSYDPEGTVTRAEMAKMICVILNGGKDPSLGNATTNTFTDTVGHWASPYIEYCTKLGIISGRGDGTFDPNGNVTGSEAAKMLLAAAGYQAAIEGFTGANWEIATNVRANQVDLYEDVTLAPSAALNRDNAAQMVYNTLDIKVVTYKYTLTTDGSSISSVPELQYKNATGVVDITVLEDKFGAVKVEGVVVGNEFADLSSEKTNNDKAPAKTVIGSALDAGKTQVLVTNGEDQSAFANKEYTFSVSTGEDVLGKTVAMYVKPASTSLKSTVIGSAILSTDNVIVTDASGDSIKDVADDNNLDITADTKYVYNYASIDTKVPTGKDSVTGIQKTLVDTDNDGDVDYVLLKEMGLGKVTLYTEAKDGQIVVAINGGNLVNKDKADIIGFEDVAKDDYVLSAYFGGRLYLQKAETVTGTIEAYKQKADKTYTGGYRNTGFTVDGTTYTVSYVNTYAGSDIISARNYVDKTILSSDATFYCDLNGYVIAFGEVDESAYKYAYVWGAEAGSTISTDRVKVTTEDGKTKTYDLSSNSDIDVVAKGNGNGLTTVAEDVMQGRVYAYTVTSGGELKLYLPKGGAVKGAEPTFTKGLTAIHLETTATKDTDLTKAGVTPAIGKTYYSNNATTFFYVTYKKNTTTIDKVAVYNGRNNAPSVDGKDGTTLLALKDADGTVGAAVFTGVSIAESAGDHMFVYNANYVWEDYGYVDAYLNGSTEASKDVKAALYKDGEIVHNPEVKDGIYLYKLNSDGYYELTRPTMKDQSYFFTGRVGRVNVANNTFVILDKANAFVQEFQLTKDSIVVDYDSSHSSPVAYTSGSVAVGDTVEVIVNNSKDSEVLMAVITDRDDVSNPNNPVIIGWEVPEPYVTLTELADVADVHAEFKAGNNVLVNGDWTPDADLTIPTGYTLMVNGDLTGTGETIKNGGTLMVKGDLITDQATLNGEIKAIDLTLSAATTTLSANVTLENDLTATNHNVTVSADKTLNAGGDINLGTGTLTNNGHVEWDGTLTAKNAADYSKNSLKGGDLVVEKLTVGDNKNAGNVSVTSLKADLIELKSGSTAAVTGDLAANKTSGVIVNGYGSETVTLAVSGDIVNDITADTVDLTADQVKGNLTLKGDANATVSSATSIDNQGTGSVETTDSKADTQVKGTIKTDATYGGNVTLANGTEIAKDASVTVDGDLTLSSGEGTTTVKGSLTVNGTVTGLKNLTGEEDAKVIFGAKATIAEGEDTSKFVDKDGNAVPAADIPGKTFVVDEDGNFVYSGSTVSDVLLEAEAYEYDGKGYTYTGDITLSGNTATFKYTAEQGKTVSNVTNDLSRFLGAMHRGGSRATEIVYGKTTFVWDNNAVNAAGNSVKGSCWYDSEDDGYIGADVKDESGKVTAEQNTLMSAIMGKIGESKVPTSPIELTVDGVEIVIVVEVAAAE